MITPQEASQLNGTQRQAYVNDLFNRIATPYDRLNRWMSLGQDQAWRREAIRLGDVSPGDTVVDLGTGTGDLYFLLRETVGPDGRVIGLDLSEKMLEVARHKAEVLYPDSPAELELAGAGETHLENEIADVVTMGWVLRNVGDRPAAYREILRILKPGGRFVCVEMSQPDQSVFKFGSQLYLRVMMPLLIRMHGADSQAYRYLAESTARFPSKKELAQEWKEHGFAEVQVKSLMLGQIAIHVGQRTA
ncbi:Demethylmenaquinone methyltransferase [Planctomycetales bacterium 10988]|nr:Demethylmenaquinone methyltransferase [Planctomycetales bacterium 10988]